MKGWWTVVAPVRTNRNMEGPGRGKMASSALAAKIAVVALLLPSAVEWRGSPHTVVIRTSARFLAGVSFARGCFSARTLPRNLPVTDAVRPP